MLTNLCPSLDSSIDLETLSVCLPLGITYLKASSHNKIITSQGVVFYQTAFLFCLGFMAFYLVRVICFICFI
jgi:hypothetical protein